MIRLVPSTLIKFLLGVLLVQAATAIQVIAAMASSGQGTWLLFALLSVTTGVFAALWLASIASHGTKETLHRAREGFSREREKIRVRAEQDKNKIVASTHRRVAREANRVRAKASFKVGAAVAGVLGLGGLMLLTQFFTLGLTVLATTGGAVAGYLIRARREERSGQLLPRTPALRSIGAAGDSPESSYLGDQKTLVGPERPNGRDTAS